MYDTLGLGFLCRGTQRVLPGGGRGAWPSHCAYAWSLCWPAWLFKYQNGV